MRIEWCGGRKCAFKRECFYVVFSVCFCFVSFFKCVWVFQFPQMCVFKKTYLVYRRYSFVQFNNNNDINNNSNTNKTNNQTTQQFTIQYDVIHTHFIAFVELHSIALRQRRRQQRRHTHSFRLACTALTYVGCSEILAAS